MDHLDKETNVKALIKFGLTAVIILIVVFGSFGTIGAGERGIKTRFSAIIGTVNQGAYFKVPFIDSVHVMDVKTRTISYEKKGEFNSQLSGASKDLQDVYIGVVVTYHVNPEQVSVIYASYSDVNNYETNVIAPMVRTITKTTAAQYTAEELVTKRAEFSEKVNITLHEQMAEKGSVLENFSVTNFDFSDAFAKAIEAKVTAVQLADAQKNKLEQVKYEAQQIVETAKATAEAQRISSAALAAQGGRDYVQLKAIEKWNGVLPTSIPPNGTVPFINLK